MTQETSKMRTFRARDCRRYRNWRASARYIRGKHINRLVYAYQWTVFEKVTGTAKEKELVPSEATKTKSYWAQLHAQIR